MASYRGIFPIVPTAFNDSGDLDLESQRRAADYLIDAGAHGLCLLANYSEQFSLSDSERDRIIDVVMDHVAGRVPIIVTTSHFSSRVAAERSKRAQATGASMVMVMPPYHGATLRVAEAGIQDAFTTIAEAIDIPILVQDAPMAGTLMSAEFLAGLARSIPNVSYFKLEAGVAADKIRRLIALGGDAVLGPFDGEESITLIPDLEAGASGTMPGGTTVDVLRETWDLWHEGRHHEAVAAYHRALPVITYENKLCGLMATKALMVEGVILASDAPRHPYPPLSPSVRAGLIAMARRLDLLVLRWGR
ncbi:MAG: dihydrodipicolinate synthase family protein [Chloroflexota bacterium]